MSDYAEKPARLGSRWGRSMRCEIDRDLALRAWEYMSGGRAGWTAHDYDGIDYRDPRSWGLLIEAIEALPGVEWVDLTTLRGDRRTAVAWNRRADALAETEGDCYGEALARLLVALAEREGAE